MHVTNNEMKIFYLVDQQQNYKRNRWDTFNVVLLSLGYVQFCSFLFLTNIRSVYMYMYLI